MLKTSAGRALTSAIIFGIALDLTLAYSFTTIFAGPEFWFLFSAILAFLWLAPLIFGFKSMLYKIIFHYAKRGSIRRTLVQGFRKAGLPLLSETGHNDPADQYFTEVAEDDSLPKSARLYASATLGQLVLIPMYSKVDTLFSHANLDAALATYFDEMRRDGVQPHPNSHEQF